MSDKSLSVRAKRLDDSIMEARELLAEVQRRFDVDLSAGANINRGSLVSLQKAFDAISGDVVAEVAKTVPDLVTPDLHARANRHRGEIYNLDKAGEGLLRELCILRNSIKAAYGLLQLFSERANILGIEYSVGAEAVTEHNMRIMHFIADTQSLVTRYRNLERAIQALMMLEGR